ncbi:MAG TPA: aminoacyl-tRNA hydrolase [Gemmatimonadales bacterium]|nr:aminoacyl-tRNA hydrolase [Gemmatimonadales bacterium]
MRAILGLGNPGPEYEDTRHNAGFLLADRLAQRWRAGPFRRQGPSRVAAGERAGTPFQIIKPQTYMNRSGAALALLRALPEFDPASDLLVLVDEVALDLGRFRLRGAGSAGGHNGLRSIEGALLRQDYARLRIGVGPRPMDYDDLADYVLDRFTSEERARLDELLDTMCQAVECWLEEGIERAMNRFNRPAPNPE